MLLRLLGWVLVAVGLALALGGARAFAWFGHLPGDLRFEGGSTRVLVPLTSMLLVSVVLTAFLWIARRLG
jgi:Protein of unknown function (DUF2905)